MEQQWHEVCIEGDEGDEAFSHAAPFLVESLQIVESTQVVSAVVQLAFHLNVLASDLSADGTASFAPSMLSPTAINSAIENLHDRQMMMHPFFDAIMTTFAHIQYTQLSSFTSTQNACSDHCRTPLSSAPRYMDGLILPPQVLFHEPLFTQPAFDYASFSKNWKCLTAIVTNATLFTGCEPRLRVLQSRYALHRAYNGSREDQCHTTFGGGHVARAPKLDIRRLETCVSSATLVAFIERMQREKPDYVVIPVTRRDVAFMTRSEGETRSLAPQSTGLKLESGSVTGLGGNSCEKPERAITMRELVARFFSAEATHDAPHPRAHREGYDAIGVSSAPVFTPECLCLCPHYASGDGGRWLDLGDLAAGGGDSGSSGAARAERAQAFLAHFLSIHNVNRGEFLADLVVPVVSRVTASSGTRLDALELEVTVTGRERGELARIAEWCVRSGILESDQVQFCVRVTQDAFSTRTAWCDAAGMALNARCHPDSGNRVDGHSDGASPTDADVDDAQEAGTSSVPWWWEMCRSEQRSSCPDPAHGCQSSVATASLSSAGALSCNAPTPAKTFADVLENIFAPIWAALMDPASHPYLAQFLKRLVSFAVSLGSATPMQELPVSGDPSHYTTSPTTLPPDAFFVFHIYRNVQLLNCFSCAHMYFHRAKPPPASSPQAGTHGAEEAPPRSPPCFQPSLAQQQHHSWALLCKCQECFPYYLPPGSLHHHHAPLLPSALRFRLYGRGSSDSRSTLTESTLGLLLADEVVNTSYTLDWGPLAYLYYLTQRHIILTPSRNYHSNSIIRETLTKKAIPFAIRIGLHLSIATFDPLFYNTTDDALFEELEGIRKQFSLSIADVTEMCLRSASNRVSYPLLASLQCGKNRTHLKGSGEETAMSGHCAPYRREAVFGAAWPHARAHQNNFSVTQVSSLRLRFRNRTLRHEMALLCRKGFSLLRMQEHQSMLQSSPQLSAMHQSTVSFAMQLAFTNSPALEDNMCSYNNTLSSAIGLSLETRSRRLRTFFNTPLPFRPISRSQGSDDVQPRETAGSHLPRSRYGQVESSLQFPRILITGPQSESPSPIAKALVHCMTMRYHYQQHVVASHPARTTLEESSTVFNAAPPPPSPLSYKSNPKNCNDRGGARNLLDFTTQPRPQGHELKYVLRDGIFDVVFENTCSGVGNASARCASKKRHPLIKSSLESRAAFTPLPTWATFERDVKHLRTLSSDVDLQRFCKKRLDMLECKYLLHAGLTNDDEEPYCVQIPLHTEDESLRARPSAFERHPDSTQSTLLRKAAGAAADHTASTQGAGVDKSHGTFTRQAFKDCAQQSQPCSLMRRRDLKGDICRIVKVDVHCHVAGSFTAKALLSFIKNKLQNNPEDIVGVDPATHRPITLGELFKRVIHERSNLLLFGGARASVGSSGGGEHVHAGGCGREDAGSNDAVIQKLQELTVAALDVQAGKITFNRFDDFNSRYSPMRASALRSLFLKTDNFMNGRYFAELIRGEVFAKQAREGNIFSEQRVSIYGRDPEEWARLAKWFALQDMAHHTNRWLVQVPRLFGLYRRTGLMDNFEQMLVNVFRPLWDASLEPVRHPLLHYFLQHVSGFDSVDNESDRELDMTAQPMPAQWTLPENPPYAYYMYYMWANITTLNRFRASRGLSTFDFRPHAGESGDPDHMADVFLLANGVGHGINLDKRPTLQYLFYIAQIPLAIVPLSNNALFCKYADNPFPVFFRRGLNVSLGTDGALMFHNTDQPLIEEYTTARNFWGLTTADLCEIAKNGVLMSGFSPEQKASWLGERFALHSVVGNDVARSHVPMTRCAMRYEVYIEEILYLEARAAMDVINRAMRTPAEEELFLIDRFKCTRAEALAQLWWGQTEAESTQRGRDCKRLEGKRVSGTLRNLGLQQQRLSSFLPHAGVGNVVLTASHL